MLTGRMLRVKRSDGLIQPAFVDIEAKRYRRMATDLMDMVKAHIDRSRDDLVEAIDGMIGDNVQHRAHRGLAKLLMDEFCTFGMRPGPAPEDVRKVVFRLSRRHHPVVDDDTRTSILIRAAQELGVEVGDVEELLYADLPSAHRLLSFEAPSIDALLHRYNLALAQALLYYADRVRIRVKRRPGSKLSTIARYVKRCHLMHHVRMEGDAYEFLLEGPMTLLRQTRKYGIRLATFLPGLLLCKHWALDADVRVLGRKGRFLLDSDCELQSNHAGYPRYDSELEAAFARAWRKRDTPWTLEREGDFVCIGEHFIIPDFELRHPDGRRFLLEIVGYWRPSYIERKFAQLREAQREDIIVAISSKLNVEEASLADLPGPVVWFKTRLKPESVLTVIDMPTVEGYVEKGTA